MNQNRWNIEEMIELYQSILKVLLRSTLQEWFALDITLAQLKVLFLLSQEPSLTVGTVAQAIGISLPTASQLIDRLVQAGLAQRGERSTDRRYTQVSLTPSGEQLVRRLRQGHQDRLRSWLQSLNEEEMIQLRAGLLALARLAHLPLAEESRRQGPPVEERIDLQELSQISLTDLLQDQL